MRRPDRWQRFLIGEKGAAAALALVAIAIHLVLRFGWDDLPASSVNLPLWVALFLGGLPLLGELAWHVARREFGADLLAGISIITAVILGEWLAGTLVVLMLSGGSALEAYAVRSASAALETLANRMPTTARRRTAEGLEEVAIDDLAIGDIIVVLPHDVCPADGTVIEGRGSMDESYLTGEPYVRSKTPGSGVFSGAINGDAMLTIRADRRPVDSRFARIMAVMEQSQQQRPRMRRLADRLGAIYTPIALAVAIAAWLVSGDPVRFLAVLVVATPCPLLIAIPVAILGAISLAARRSIVIRDPMVLERIPGCRAMILDKTGTLTYGKPRLTAEHMAPGRKQDEVLQLAASLEQYAKHPLGRAVLEAARTRGLVLQEADEISEPPGQGMTGRILDHDVRLTSRGRLLDERPEAAAVVPESCSGLECVVMVDGEYAALYQFRDAPRDESRSFIGHLAPRHGIREVLLVSGDRESEVRYLAEQVGIVQVYAEQSPERKVEIVREQNALGPTMFVGDGINDAPALITATVGVAMGTHSDVTIEAAGAVILDSSLLKVDELLHISRRMRRIALQSAVGGMVLSVGAMLVAAAGYLPPVAGALTQEVIDVVVILNALRMAIQPRALSDVD